MENGRKPRKGFGFSANLNAGFAMRRLAPEIHTNGRAPSTKEKDVASLFSSMGFSVTPQYGGGDEITQPFLESWVVYACARVIAEAVEQVGFIIRSGPGEDAQPVDQGHPLVKLFSKPNPWTSWSQLTAMGSIHRNLSGEDFWFLADAKGNPLLADLGAENDPMAPIPLPVAIHSMNGHCVADDRNSWGRVVRWKYSVSTGKQVHYPAGSVLHFRNYDPTDPCRGLGPAEVAMRQLSIAFQAERYGEATLRAGGPGAFIIYEQEMTPEVQRGFQGEIDAVAEDPRTVGKYKVLTGKPHVVPVPQSPKDMLSIDMLEWSRDVVASLFGVPLPIIGVLDNATYSNMQEAWHQFWLRITAYLKTIEDVINTSFFPRLQESSMQRLRFQFDLERVAALKADDSKLIELAKNIAAAGIGVPLNEALALVGSRATQVPSGDQALFLTQMQVAPSQPKAQPNAERLIKVIDEELGNGTTDTQA